MPHSHSLWGSQTVPSRAWLLQRQTRSCWPHRLSVSRPSHPHIFRAGDLQAVQLRHLHPEPLLLHPQALASRLWCGPPREGLSEGLYTHCLRDIFVPLYDSQNSRRSSSFLQTRPGLPGCFKLLSVVFLLVLLALIPLIYLVI